MLTPFRLTRDTDPELIQKAHRLWSEASSHDHTRYRAVGDRLALREIIRNSESGKFYSADVPEAKLAVIALQTLTVGRSQIEILAVDPNLRGRGIGRRALKDLIGFAKSDGARVVEVASRVEAVPFYLQNGFTRDPHDTDDRYPTLVYPL